jgi:arginine dihydrolase
VTDDETARAGAPQGPEVPQAPQAVLQRRFLMCSPEHFAITFEINPWMGTGGQPDQAQSMKEWENLASCLQAAGATVLRYPSVHGLSDMVFPADVAVASGGRYAPARFRHAERRAEAEHGRERLTGLGMREMTWWDDGSDAFLEGGDVVAFADVLVAGHGLRTTQEAHRALARCFGRRVAGLRLVDPRFYHLDMSLCPLDARHAIVAPDAWDRASVAVMAGLVAEPLVIDLAEAMTFCANSVVVGRTVMMPACPPRVGRQLEVWGFDVCVCPVDEFLKAGGGIRCMTLDLDLLGG